MFRSQGARAYPLILKTWHCSNGVTGLNKKKRKGKKREEFQIKQNVLFSQKKSHKMYTKFEQITALRVIGLTRSKTFSFSDVFSPITY